MLEKQLYNKQRKQIKVRDMSTILTILIIRDAMTDGLHLMS